MSDDNGFVERPTIWKRGPTDPNCLTIRLRATAENGKAVRISRYLSGDYRRMPGFKLHCAKQPDGTYLAWCERIEAPK